MRKEAAYAMAENKSLCLPDGNGGTGMTNEQYKGMLLDQLEDWEEIFELAVKNKDTEIKNKAEKQIVKINKKMRF